MAVIPFVPQVCDWVRKDLDPPHDVQVLTRFDSIELGVDLVHPDLPHMSVEITMDGPGLVEIPVADFRVVTDKVETFVANAFQVPKGSWPRAIDENLSVEFLVDGTKMKFEAGTIAAPFEREIDFFLALDGTHMLRAQPFDASDPVRLHTWVVFRNAVDSLVELNNGGNINLGI